MLKIIIFISLFSSPALAYIDPATGSIVISFIVGIFSILLAIFLFIVDFSFSDMYTRLMDFF